MHFKLERAHITAVGVGIFPAVASFTSRRPWNFGSEILLKLIALAAYPVLSYLTRLFTPTEQETIAEYYVAFQQKGFRGAWNLLP